MVERILMVGPRGRLLMLGFILLFSAIAGFQLPRLKVDRSDERLIAADDPGWIGLRQVEQKFGHERSVVIYLRARNLWTPERLRAIEARTEALATIPGIVSVKSLLSATNIRDKGDFVDAGPLVDIVPDPAQEGPEVAAKRIAEIRSDALYGPFIRRNFVSADGNATLIRIGYDSRPLDPDYELQMFRAIESAIAPLRREFDVVFQLGAPRLSVEIDHGLRDDFKRLIPLAVLILVTAVTLFLRSPRLVPIPLVTSAITILWTFGFMAAAGIPITLLTAILPALIVVVGSVEDVHICAAYLEGIDPESPHIRRRAVRHMAKHVGPAIVITSLTTVLGFASNILTDIPLIREFALAASFAMAVNFIVTLAVIPLMLQWFGPKKNPLRGTSQVPSGIVGGAVRVIEALSDRFPIAVVAGFALVLLGLSFQLGELKVDDDPISYFPPDAPFVRDVHTVHRDLAGLQSFTVMLTANKPGWFRTVAGVQAIARVQSLLDRQGIYDQTLSLADLMALMHRETHHGARQFNVIPNAQSDLDLYLAYLPPSELQSFVTEDYSTAAISVRHNIAASMHLNRAVRQLQQAIPGVLGSDARCVLAGKNLMVNRAADSLIDNELSSLLLALGVITVLFAFLYTSVLAGLLALVPNVIPIILNFGLMSWLGVPLNPGTAMVAAIAIGLAVDDTIHLMIRYGSESRERIDERSAARVTIRGEAVPVITSAVALALGFAVLGLSDFRIVAQFGLLCAATMVFGAVSDLLLMPILLRQLRLATIWDIISVKLDRDALVQCPMFRGLSTYQVKKVALLSEIEEFATGSVVIRQGNISSGMYILLRGTVQVSVIRDGVKLELGLGRPGDVFGEIGFAGENVERTATVTTLEAVTLVKIEPSRALRGLRFYPGIAIRLYRNISHVLARRLVSSDEKLLRSMQR